jgi:hypothetical protein
LNYNQIPDRYLNFRRALWRRKYERLARDVRVAQERFLHALVRAANKSIAQQKHQVLYGRLAKQHKDLRNRTLELAAKRKEALNPRHWTLAGSNGPDYLTPEEEREFEALLVRTGRTDDVKRVVAANSDCCRMERVRR